MILVFQVISQEHILEGSCNFFGYESVKVSYYLAKFDAHRHSGEGDIMLFVFHMNLQDHAIKTLYNLMIGSHSR